MPRATITFEYEEGQDPRAIIEHVTQQAAAQQTVHRPVKVQSAIITLPQGVFTYGCTRYAAVSNAVPVLQYMLHVYRGSVGEFRSETGESMNHVSGYNPRPARVEGDLIDRLQHQASIVADPSAISVPAHTAHLLAEAAASLEVQRRIVDSQEPSDGMLTQCPRCGEEHRCSLCKVELE
jgi:hypothetical protein